MAVIGMPENILSVQNNLDRHKQKHEPEVNQCGYVTYWILSIHSIDDDNMIHVSVIKNEKIHLKLVIFDELTCHLEQNIYSFYIYTMV